tara:strand:- start:356 stop:1024 length:669 start_codon:yes stop_codon:yes gene_type:complete
MSFDGDLYPTAGASTVMSTKGDMVDFDTARQRLAIGSASDVLTVTAGGLPAWTAPASGGGLWKFQGEIDPSGVTNATLAFSDPIAPDEGYYYGRYRGTATSGQGFEMQVGGAGGLETGASYDTIGMYHNTSGTQTNIYGINQVRFAFALSSFVDSNPFEADCFLHVTDSGAVITSVRMMTESGWGTWGGILPITLTGGITQVLIGLGASFTGNLQFWSCSTS